MATLTLGQMLDIALGAAKAGAIDFEQLHSLLNGVLLHLGLQDVPVQENGEPLEGAEASPFSASFLEELKRKLEANEKEMAELRAQCQELHEEATVMKAEQARMAEEMLNPFESENFQNMLEDLRSQMMETVMSTMRDMMNPGARGSPNWQQDGANYTVPDNGLIVIGNEITLVERTPTPRHGDTKHGDTKHGDAKHGDNQPASPPPPKAKTQGRGKDFLEGNASSHRGSFGANDIKDEDIKISISKAETLPGYLDVPPGMTDVGEIKDEETKIRISKKKNFDGFTASGIHPGAPGTPVQAMRVQSAQGHQGSQTLWTPAESEAGTSSRPSTSKEAHREGGFRMEPFPSEDGMMLLKMSSSEYLPCDQVSKFPGRRSEFISSTPPPYPGFSGRLPYGLKENREQAPEGYSRSTPRYCGGRHTSNTPVQPMEPLLPNPNKPGVVELVGKDGMVYRGRTPQWMF